jgi:hypothetical protein
MEKETLLHKIQSVKLCLMAHPDNEQDSEFEDRIDDLQEIEDSLGDTSKSLDPQQGWISVKERLPKLEDADENGKVLLYRKLNEDQKSLSVSIHDWSMVKHCDEFAFWMNLPPKPTTNK